jgi:hypothetical protein
MPRKWIPVLVAGALSGAFWIAAAVQGLAAELIWLPAVAIGAAWPRERGSLGACLARLRKTG